MKNSGELSKILITVILAVSLSVAAKAQYQLPPSVEQQEFSYSQDGSYFQPQGQFQAYRQQPQRLTQIFGNGARSTSTFTFGPRKVAVQVNHHDANAFVNYDGQHGAPGYQFSSSPSERAVNQFPPNYQLQNSLPSQNAFPSNNPQQNADYNAQQNVAQNAYTITNPINGQKYSLGQPKWDQSTYDVNINYKNQEKPQTFTTAAPPLHNFQFHNNFVPQTNIFSQFGQRAPSQSGFLFNNRPVYSNPTLTNFQNALTQNAGYNLQIPQQYPNYEVSDPNQLTIQRKLVYTQPSTDDVQFRFSSGSAENEVPNEGNTVQTLPEVPSFESAKLTTKQEIVKNTTVITLIDEEIHQETDKTSAPLTVTEQTTPAAFDLPVVEDAKVRSGPSPTIVQPSTPNFERQSQYYNKLVKVPDYSGLYRSQATPTQQPTQTVPHNFNLYFQPTPGLETSTSVAPVNQRLQQPGDYYFQTTQKPLQQSEYVFYQSTPGTPSINYQGLLPGQINNGLSSNGNLQEFNPIEEKNQRKETLYTVNGFEEDLPDITTEKALSQPNPISLEQSFTGNYEETKVTEGNIVTELPTTTELPLTTTANPFSNVFYGTTVDDNLSNRNGVQYPTTLPSDNSQGVSSITSGANIEDISAPFSPLQHSSSPDFEGSKSTETNQESVSNQNHYYNFVSSSTPPVTTITDQNLVTEAIVPVVSDSPADSQSTVSTSRGYDREAAIRRKKVRVYKKPTIDEGLQDQQQSLDRDRVNKHRNEYRGRRIRPNQQNLVTTSTSLPETTQRVIPRGRYHATIPQRGRVTFHRTTTQSVIDETPSQPTIAPEYNEEAVSHPISSTISHLREQSHFTPRESTSTTRGFESDRTFQTSTASQTRIPQPRYQSRQRTRPTVPNYRHETTTILQETTTPITDDIKTTKVIQFTSRYESNTKQETIEFEQTHPTEATVDATEPTREPEQVFTSQRTRVRGPYQRGPGEDRPLRKHERPVFSLKKHNFNGRIKVTNPVPTDGQEEQPEERKQVKYHAVKNSPQRQMVIRRIKVKSNHRPESSEMDDQDASGTIRTSYRRNQALQDSLNKKIPSTIVRNSIRFPPRKPLSRFSITTAKEEILESSSESTITPQTSPMMASENQGNLGTTINVQDTELVTTERIEIHQESTTTKVTEKRQTSDDPDLKDLVENAQSLQEDDINVQNQGLESLMKPDEQNIKFENEPYENPSNIYTAEKQEDDWEDENPGEVIIHSLPEEIDSSIHSGIIDDPVETDVVPSIAPSQNPSEIVTRIDVVTSISEEDGQNRRVEDISEISTSEELVQ